MKFNCAYDEIVEIRKLIPNPKNPNSHSDEQVERLSKIIDYQGQRSPIVVSKRSGFITKGHGRLLAMQKLGWEKVAVNFQEYNDEEQEYSDIIAELNLKVRAIICWYKIKSGLGAFMSQYIPNYEPCIYALKKNGKVKWNGPSNEKTVWELKKDFRNEYHPTQKPVELSERAIMNSSDKGDLVYDCFLGSGSTIIGAEKTGRKCYGMELDEKYCDVIINRWQNYTGKRATLELTGQTYEELKQERENVTT